MVYRAVLERLSVERQRGFESLPLRIFFFTKYKTMDHLIEKLDQIEQTFKEIDVQLADPNVVSDQNKLKVLARTRRQLEPTIRAYDDYRKIQSDLADWQSMLRETQDKD